MSIFITGWQVAYRQKPAGTILEDQTSPFSLVPNTWRYMAADPFIFEKKGTTYLFAELVDNITFKGVIGYSVWNGKRFTRWRLLIREKHHLSFPNVFEHNGELLIVPEAYQSREIFCYRATSFPAKWQRCAPLLTGMSCVDTVFFRRDSQSFGLTCRLSSMDGLNKPSQLLGFSTDFQTAELLPHNPLLEGNYGCRPGGRFFNRHGKLIRVSQDCRVAYGQSLIFSEMETNLVPFQERVIAHVGPEQIRLNKEMKIYGVHTFNGNDNFEVIDVQPMTYNVISIISRIMHKLLRILKAR